MHIVQKRKKISRKKCRFTRKKCSSFEKKYMKFQSCPIFASIQNQKIAGTFKAIKREFFSSTNTSPEQTAISSFIYLHRRWAGDCRTHKTQIIDKREKAVHKRNLFSAFFSFL